MNNSLQQLRVLRGRFTRLGGAAVSVMRAALLMLVALVTLCPLPASAQNDNALKLPDGFINEAYAMFDFAAAVKGEGDAQWTVVPLPVPRGMLPPGLTLNADGKLNGIPTSAGLYMFKVKAVVGGVEPPTFSSTVVLRILPAARFDPAVVNAAGAESTSTLPAASFNLPPCTPAASSFVLASSTADEETVALTEEIADDNLTGKLNTSTLQILDADGLIQTTLGNGAAVPASVFRKGDYTVIHIIKWKAANAETGKTDPAKELWALYEFTEVGGGSGLGWVARMNPDDKENFDTRIFGSRRVAVLMLHLQTPRTWDVKYKIDINRRVPQPIQNALQLGRFVVGAGVDTACEPTPLRNIWGGRLLLVRHTASDVIVKLNTVTAGSDGAQVSQSKEHSKTYLNEGRYHWDVSVGMPLKGIKELEFSAENGVVTAKKKERQNAYGFLNLFPRAVDLNGKSYLTSPHFVLGVPISGKPLDRPLVGVGTGFYTEQFKINFFAGVAFNKVREPRTLAAGQAATGAQLESDIETRRVRKFVFGINFPVKQFIDAVKGSK